MSDYTSPFGMGVATGVCGGDNAPLTFGTRGYGGVQGAVQ